MDKFVYSAFEKYFHAVRTLGYVSDKKVNSLLVLNFFYDLMYNDYRGYIKKEDYYSIDRALNCLYGTNCLIPYPNYLRGTDDTSSSLSGYPMIYYGNSTTILNTGEEVSNLNESNLSTVNDTYNNKYYYIAVHSSKNLKSVVNRGVEIVTDNFELKNSSLIIASQSGSPQTYKLYECSINSDAEEGDMYIFELTINIE